MTKIRKKRRKSTWLFAALELCCLVTMGVNLRRRRIILALACLANILLLILPVAMERAWGIHCTEAMRNFYYLFVFGSILVGTVWDVYYKTGNFDMLMHAAAGFLFAGVGYGIFFLFHPDAEAHPMFLMIVAVSFSLALSLLWELFEAGMLFTFGMDMQRDAVLNSVATSYFTNQDAVSDVLHITATTVTGSFGSRTIPGAWDMGFVDTVTDMLVETIGALVFVLLGCFRRGKYIRAFIPTRIPSC